MFSYIEHISNSLLVRVNEGASPEEIQFAIYKMQACDEEFLHQNLSFSREIWYEMLDVHLSEKQKVNLLGKGTFHYMRVSL